MSLSNNYPAISPSLLLDFAGTKKLDPRITFTRTTTASYYDGITTAKAEQNLLSYSQEFNNSSAWSKSNITVTDNTGDTTAPDGTSTASKTIATATTSSHYNQRAVGVHIPVTSGQVYSLSIFAKAGTETVVQLTAANATAFGVNAYANFDLSAGTIGTVGSAVSNQSIVSVGNGWYRISFTCSATANDSNGSFIIAFTNNNSSASRAPSFTAAGTEAFYVWGAQLEQRSAVTAYTATTTQPITNYIPVLQTAGSGVPRFDHNPITDVSLGLLIEEQRTNLLTYSDDFANAAWIASSYTLTSNTIVAPDGTLTGDKLAANTGASLKVLVRASAVSITAGTVYTASAYVKNSGVQYVSFTFDDNTTTNGVTTTFDLTNGTISRAAVAYGTGASAASSITAVGNSWYRITITGTAGTTSVLGRFAISIQSSGTTQFNNYTGDGYSGIYIWGAQLEAGAFPTSYIPTTSASVTRNADSASMTGTNFSSWYRADEGTVYAEGFRSILGNYSGYPWIYGINDNTTSNEMGIYGVTASTQTVLNIAVSGSGQLDYVFGNWTSNPSRTATAYKVNDTQFAFNGSAKITDTSCLIPVVDRLHIGRRTTGNYWNGTVSKLAYYPVRVTNAQLQALTS